MKKLLSLITLLFLALSIVGCSNKYENGELQIFMPGEYINMDVVSAFEKEYKVKVGITTFDSNEAAFTKLSGGTVYDIIIPSDYMLERFISEKMVQKLDKSRLECLDELYEGVLNMDFDPNNDYSVPYFWGNVGIVYDADKVDPKDVESQGFDVLRNTKYKGMIYMYDSIRDVFMMAQKTLGYSMNTTDEDELNACYNWLVDIAVNMDPAYVTDTAIDGLMRGTKAMGMMYSGDAAAIIAESDLNMAFYAPETGTNYWVDAMCIHKDAANIDNAYAFINYITSYDAAYENSAYVGYASVNAEVLKDLVAEDGDYEGNDAYIPRDRVAEDETYHLNTKELENMMETITELWSKAKIQ